MLSENNSTKQFKNVPLNITKYLKISLKSILNWKTLCPTWKTKKKISFGQELKI